jgi:serine/threonine protein kinase
LRRYAHPHLLSVFASYLQYDSIFVLFTPAPAWSLKSFLSDVPKVFEHLSKSQRRQKLLSWTHCLASVLRWLHKNGKHHGAIRPSNIQVTDDDFHLYLGQFGDPGVLGTHTKVDDLESYQYAAPVSLPSSGFMQIRSISLDLLLTLTPQKMIPAAIYLHGCLGTMEKGSYNADHGTF